MVAARREGGGYVVKIKRRIGHDHIEVEQEVTPSELYALVVEHVEVLPGELLWLGVVKRGARR